MHQILDRPRFPHQFYDHCKRFHLASPGIFVFGSNLAGIHGAGAARDAHRLHDARYGVGSGFTGSAYAIPTKGKRLEILNIKEIEYYVEEFVCWTISENKHTVYPYWYFVTPIGTGLAGFKHSQIAPLFQGAVNCWFPDIWRPYIFESHSV